MTEDARAGLYDVVCQDEYKRVFIIEMQVDNYENLLKRLQFYAFQMFTAYAKKGKKGFDEMNAVHCICIINHHLSNMIQRYINGKHALSSSNRFKKQRK